MNKNWWVIILASIGLTGHSVAFAEVYTYNAVVVLCTGTCDSFASLDVGSEVTGHFNINTTPGGSAGDSDMGEIELTVFNPALPVSGPVGDPVNDNPLFLSSTLGIIASNGSSFTTNASNELDGGQILVEFLVPPFSSNGAFIVMDASTGVSEICLFYATAGCIPGATQAVVSEGGFSLYSDDSDSDGVNDNVDNCKFVPNPAQRDTNGDGIGNACDADLNDDCVVNFIDLGLLRTVFFTSDPVADFNGDGVVNPIDLGIIKSQFFAPPGPSGVSNTCSPD